MRNQSKTHENQCKREHVPFPPLFIRFVSFLFDSVLRSSTPLLYTCSHSLHTDSLRPKTSPRCSDSGENVRKWATPERGIYLVYIEASRAHHLKIWYPSECALQSEPKRKCERREFTDFRNSKKTHSHAHETHVRHCFSLRVDLRGSSIAVPFYMPGCISVMHWLLRESSFRWYQGGWRHVGEYIRHFWALTWEPSRDRPQ